MTVTHSAALKTDPDVAKAKEMLLKAVQKQQKTITGIRPPDPNLEAYYANALKTLAQHRGMGLWYPYLGSGIGKGPLVELLDGSVKYDFIGGIGVHPFGHSHHELISATLDAAITDVVMQGNLQPNGDSSELIEMLVTESKLDHCFLSTSGAMANDNALKIAFQKNYPANRILAFERSFCGRTWAMSQITEKPDIREGLPVQLGVDYLPFFDPNAPEESTKRAVDRLKRYLWRHPKGYAMMIFELIQGEGGFYPGSRDFFCALIDILKDHHIAICIDEVQTFGRTSKLFAFQHFGLENFVDIVTIGKLSQVCATLFTKEYAPRPNLISQTFTSSTAAIHAAKKIIHLMIKEGFFGENGKNMALNAHMAKNFEDIAKKHPGKLCGPYGLGAMIAFTPLGGGHEQVMQFGHALFKAGVISFICGKEPTRIRFLAPVGAMTAHDVDHVTTIVESLL